jgi:UDP-N-acetylmuramoyl-L-alanyl-D-glutamate--2,6-diaminopimelate ligase
MAALAVGLTQGITLDVIAEALASMPGIPGRFESVDEGQPFAVIVDYAHTPDGLDNVLRTARRITTGRVIVVFGCGGDRDRTKRPLMGQLAAELADHVIVTSDNPRSEAPRAIIDEITPGVAAGAAGRRVAVDVEPDRRRAIGLAVESAASGDLVLIAGKGHESYQEIAGVRHAFDDRDVVREALRAMRAGARARGPRGSTTEGAGAL